MTIHCQFKETGRAANLEGVERRHMVCQRCGFQHWSPDSPAKTYMPCRAVAQPEIKQPTRKCGKQSIVPRWMRMGWDFAKAMGHWAKEGLPVVSEEVYQARGAACDACPQKTKLGQCSVCNCFVAAKAALATEDCPLGKWS